MALPGSGPISINDIRVELGQAQANSSLRSLSALASKSSPDAMSEFYGFSASTAFTFLMGDGQQGYGDYAAACAEAYDPITLYSDSTSLGVNIRLYTDNTLSNLFDGGGVWWKSGASVYEIGNDGKITATRTC